jgi:hypothetical protein
MRKTGNGYKKTLNFGMVQIEALIPWPPLPKRRERRSRLVGSVTRISHLNHV